MYFDLLWGLTLVNELNLRTFYSLERDKSNNENDVTELNLALHF